VPNPRKPFEERALQRAFGDRVRESRLSRGWTQEKLAEASGLDRGYVSAIEHGHRNVSLNAIGRLAAGLNVPIAELFK
jgi:transcriptional regulator with XRE-family HTH domain